MFNSIVGVSGLGVGGLVVLAIVGTAVGLVLFFRRNPNKQSLVNKEVDKLSKEL
jgi:uncharacterized membrane protein